jgi:hypothetical protein
MMLIKLRWWIVGFVLVLLSIGVIYAITKTPNISWNNLSDIPPEFADGTDNDTDTDTDTLADLQCSTDQIARWNGTQWECASDNDLLANLSTCLNGQYAVWDKAQLNWICGGTPVVLGTRIFSGNATFTIPNNVTQITVEIWGGGGGGGSNSTTTDCGLLSKVGIGGGGGSGGYQKTELSVTTGDIYNIVVGIGGPGGNSSTIAARRGQTGGKSQLTTATGSVVLEVTGGGGGDGANCNIDGNFLANEGRPGGVPGASGQAGGAGGIAIADNPNLGRGGNGSNGNFGGRGSNGAVIIRWY